MARILDVPPSYFVDDMPRNIDDTGRQPASPSASSEVLLKRETLEFVRAYYRIGNPAVRERLFAMTEAIADLA